MYASKSEARANQLLIILFLSRHTTAIAISC